MAQKRMFSLSVVDTDRFVEMPVSAQALYFHLGMHGDDDGFVASPRKIARAVGCNLDDLRLLAQKNFIIPFDSGVIVIVDWNTNNTLRNDRYNPTTHQTEKALLSTTPGGGYIKKAVDGTPDGNQLDTTGIPTVSSLEPQHNITEHRLTEHSLTEREGGASRKAPPADKPPRTRFVPPGEDETVLFFRENGSSKAEAEAFRDYYQANGWKVGGRASMKDWRAAARSWIRRAGQYGSKAPASQPQETFDEQIDRISKQLESGDLSVLGGVYGTE